MKTENRVCSGLRLFLAVALAFSFIFTFSSQAIAKNKTVAKETAPKVVTVRSVSVKTKAQAMPSAVETSLQTVPTIDVGLVVAQFSAEITTEADFIVEQPEGQRTVLPKGKYFAAVEQGKIRLGEALFPGGILLEMPFNEKEAANKKLFSVNRQAYRGRLQIFVTEDGKNLTVVNQVPLEDYVNSVLGPNRLPSGRMKRLKRRRLRCGVWRAIIWRTGRMPYSLCGPWKRMPFTAGCGRKIKT